MKVMNYKGYGARIEFDAEDRCFVGHLAGIRDIVGFHGSSVDELEAAFHEAVDAYLSASAALDRPPISTNSAVEISRVSADGFSLVLGSEELSVRLSQFPWFRRATIAQLFDVVRPTPDHVHWPKLDIDLAVDSLRNPAAFPRLSSLN